MAFWDFFTFKTESEVRAEALAKASKARKLAVPHGLRSAFDDQQNALNQQRKQADAFLNDLEDHFGPAAKYLNSEYTGRSKFENIDSHRDRRVGVRWLSRAYTFDDCYVTDIQFAYTETKRGVRIDYIAKKLSGSKDVINDNYDPDRDDVYKTINNKDETFRCVRRYENHEAFVNSGDHPPAWFVAELATRKATA